MDHRHSNQDINSMTPEIFHQSLNLQECKDLAEAADTIWTCIRVNLDGIEHEEQQAILEQVADLFGDHHPERCPSLGEEWQAELEKGISRAEERIGAELREQENYTPAPWMSQAMRAADEALGRDPENPDQPSNEDGT